MDRLLDTSSPAVIGSAMGVPWQLDPDGRINVHASRPYIDPSRDYESRIVVNNGGVASSIAVNTPAMLQHDEWRDIDRTVREVATLRQVGLADLRGAGLIHNLGSIGLTISQWDRSSDMTPANVNMSGVTAGEEDTPAFATEQVPVPVVHKDFRLNVRRLEASRRFGESLDVTAASIAGRLVAEASESMLFSGRPIQVEGGVIYGYTNHPNRAQVDMDTVWTTASVTAIFDDVQEMLEEARARRHYGPYTMYIPGAYEGLLDEDYVIGDPSAGLTNGSRTLRERLLALSGLQAIRVADFLPADNVVLVQMTRDVVDLAIAQDISTIQWSVQGGMQDRFKVMAVWVPRIKSDYDGRTGVVHLRPAT